MKSIKPGRGPSGMNFVGSIVGIVFGIIWLVGAISITNSAKEMTYFGEMGGISGMPGIGGIGTMNSAPADIASIILPLFGLLFIGMGVASAIYHYKNATGKDRFSIVDIVDKHEESDPGEAWVKQQQDALVKEKPAPKPHPAGKYCTACGQRLEGDFTFCPGCGRDLSKG